MSAIWWRKQVNFQWDDEVRIVLDQHAENFYSASSLKQQSADKHGTRLGHIIPIPSQPVFANDACSVEKQQIKIREHANHYHTDAVSN